MSIDVNTLTSVARLAIRRALFQYDQAAADLGLWAMTMQPMGIQQVQTVEWVDAFPIMREWKGSRASTKTMESSIEVTIKPFERTFNLDMRRVELDADRSLITSADQLASQMSMAFVNGRVQYSYAPLRNNDITTYDNQNLIDTDHVHPDGSTFSNLVDQSSDLGQTITATGAPTVAEARVILEGAIDRLQQNRLKNVSVVETSRPTITVIAKNFGYWKGFNDLLTQNTIGTTTNQYFNSFRLVRDYDPASGTDKMVDVILSEPGGARPTIFMPFKEPGGFEVDTSRYFDERIVRYGLDAAYGFAAALPQPVVRVQE